MPENKILSRRPSDVDAAWWAVNVPSFECPDAAMEQVYDYRWALVSKHLRYASPEVGYVATEFNTMEDTWSGRFGAISCPANLQLNELRWLRDSRYANDFLRYWLMEQDIYAQNYSWSLGRACEDVCMLTGEWRVAEEHFDDLLRHQRAWDRGRVRYPNDRGYDMQKGLYWNTGRDSSGEYNLASCQLDESRRGIEGYKIRGGAGYRPDINADMYGNLRAIAHIARRRGDGKAAADFEKRAEGLRKKILSQLWEPNRQFFMHRYRYDEYAQGDPPGEKSIKAYSFSWETNRYRNGGVGFQPDRKGCMHGRELSAYWLWYYGLLDGKDGEAYDIAWRALRDPAIFDAPYGPCSAEQGDPWFSVIYGECRMNGDSWPMLTSRTLSALRHILQGERKNVWIGRKDFAELMDKFTATMWKDGQPYCAESHDPYLPRWTVDREEGIHYFHSSYCDLVLGGLIGIVPREDNILELRPLFHPEWAYCAAENVRYHGHDLSVYWDANGSRYGLGPGLTVLCDGKILIRQPAAEGLRTPLPQAGVSPAPHYVPQGLTDLAVNNAFLAYPRLQWDTEGNGKAAWVQNGRIWYHNQPVNGWVGGGGDRTLETAVLELGALCVVEQMRICFYENAKENVLLPERVCFDIMENGVWREIAVLEAARPCTVHSIPLPRLEASNIRMRLHHRQGVYVGVVEWEVWGKQKRKDNA